MKATLSYSEISSWIGKHYHIIPAIKRINDKTLEVSYKPGGFIPKVSLTLKIEAMRKDIICLSYECSNPVSLLIAGAVGHLQSRIPDGIDVNLENKRINIYIERTEKLKKVWEQVTLSDIIFSDKELVLSFTLW